MPDIIISNPEELQRKIKNFEEQGTEKLHILSDFDRTLTKSLYNEERTKTVISHLRNGNYLTEDYVSKAHALFDKYHPIEIDLSISREERCKKMEEWWKEHFNLMIEKGLDKKTLQKCVEDMIREDVMGFREGFEEFFKSLKEKNIPIIIMSASISDLLEEFIKHKGFYSNNLHVISNSFEFNKEGKVIGVKKPIIHSQNKYETEVKTLPIYNELLKRKNVLLLGDLIEDTGMIEGFPYDNLIKIGFLNENQEQNLEEYKQAYDVVILNDGNMDYINDLLKKIN